MLYMICALTMHGLPFRLALAVIHFWARDTCAVRQQHPQAQEETRGAPVPGNGSLRQKAANTTSGIKRHL